jgi:sulfatase-like protein
MEKILLQRSLLRFAASLSTAEAIRPNIVFILANDPGYGDLSCYGQQKFKTPNIDCLAAEGMKFTACSSSSRAHMTAAHFFGTRPVRPPRHFSGVW